MRPITTMILLGLCLFGIGTSTQAATTNANTNTLGPAPSTKVLIRMTVLGISEGVLFGSTVNNAGESIGFTSDTVGTNDTLFAGLNQKGTNPVLVLTNGDFSSSTNVPSLPKGLSRFTEITGYSQGVAVGNYAVSSGSRAFIFSTNGTLGLYLRFYSYPGARPLSTVITGISQGTVVGNFTDYRNKFHGFSYTPTNSSYYQIDEPQGIGRTHVTGISEGVIYGSYVTAKGITKGFTYSKGAYTTITVPGAAKFTEITGYSQGSVAGNYLDTNRVHGGFYYDGTNYSQADVGITGYSRIAGFNQGETVGNYLETNGVMYYSTSTNVVIHRDILLTTNYWETTLAAYPPHPNTKALVKYRPPASKGGNSDHGVSGAQVVNLVGTGGITVNGGTLSLGVIIYGLGSPVTDTTGLSSVNNTYSGGTFVNGGTGTITLGSSNNTVTISGSNSYIGSTSIGGGTLTVGSNSTIGITNGVSGSTNIFSGSTNTNSFGDVTNGGSLGSGSLTVSGSNTLNLGGSNTFTGGLTVTSGSLLLTNGGTLGATNSTNDIIITNGEFIDLGGSFFTNPINGLVFSPGITTDLLTISNSGSIDYTLGNFGSSNSLTISPGTSDTISFADYTGTNPDIALTLTPATATNPTSGAFLILPGSNKVEFLLH